jgi:multisubunit Na+/H+ antiporter MnhB subunit
VLGNGVAKSLRSLTTRPVDDVLSLTKAYVKQETLGPLKGAGRWIAFGVAGAIAVGMGVILLMLAVLRLTQNYMHGAMSWAPYGITLVVGLIVVGLVWFIRGRKTSIAAKGSK